MLQIQLVKSWISSVQMQSVYYSSGLTKKQLLRIRNDQKLLYGRIIRSDTIPSTESIKKNVKNGGENETADLKASVPSQSCEFYWLIQRGSNKNVRIFRSKDVEMDNNVLTNDRFNELPSNETS